MLIVVSGCAQQSAKKPVSGAGDTKMDMASNSLQDESFNFGKLNLKEVGSFPRYAVDKDQKKIYLFNSSVSAGTYVEDLPKIDLPSGRTLSFWHSSYNNRLLFFLETSFDKDSGVYKDVALWVYRLDGRQFSKMKTPYRAWWRGSDYVGMDMVLGFGSPDLNGEVRFLYELDLVNDKERVLVRLPNRQSFSAARGTDGAPIIPELELETNSISLPIFDASAPLPLCSFDYLPSGEYCTKRVLAWEKTLRFPQ